MARAVDGEAVPPDRESEQVNRTATFIWSRLDGRTSPQELAAALAEAFEGGAETRVEAWRRS
jgi:methyltransferase-like protein